MPFFAPESWSLTESILVFAACAVTIGILGTRISSVVDQLADRTGLGEAVAGAVLLGAATSLSGSVLSVTAALNNHPELAVSNALGGIAVQTFFLAVADMFYRRANLEHAAASGPNLLQNALLLVLLTLILLAPLLPEVTFWSVHPITPILFMLYIYGIRLVREERINPMWQPTHTRETKVDTPEESNDLPSLRRLSIEFVLLAGGLGLTGWILEPAATNIAAQTGLSQSAVGVLLTATSTSIPELVTSIAAVRRGALTLAVGGIVGGNAFDTLFTAASDVAYREGSIYHTMTDDSTLWVTLSLLMSSILMMGLIRRQKQGLGSIGAESITIACLYLLGIWLVLGQS